MPCTRWDFNNFDRIVNYIWNNRNAFEKTYWLSSEKSDIIWEKLEHDFNNKISIDFYNCIKEATESNAWHSKQELRQTIKIYSFGDIPDSCFKKYNAKITQKYSKVN